MGKRIVSNEELCTALLTHGTIKETAKALNISERTIYNMMSENSFKEVYEYTQVGILNAGIVACQNRLSEAINCIADIMNDKTVNAQTRLQASQTMIKYTLTMYDSMKRIRTDAEESHIDAIWDEKHNY